MGDFNINLLAYDSCKYSAEFHDMLSSHSFQPLILQPTRVTSRSQTLIDNIFSNNTRYQSKSGNITTSISDHFAQFSVLENYNTKYKSSKKTKYTIRDYRNFNHREFEESLGAINWQEIFSDENNPD